MIMRMGSNKRKEVTEEELKLYGYDTCKDYCDTYCFDYYRYKNCGKCAYHKEREERRTQYV